MNTEIDNKPQSAEFLKTARDSRDKLDKGILTVSVSFVALIFGFFKDISLYIQYSNILKIIFLLGLLGFIIAILVNLYSHHCSEKVFTGAGCVGLSKSYVEADNKIKAVDRANKVVPRLNNIQLLAFCAALIAVFITASCSIFASNNLQSTKTIQLQPAINIIYYRN